MRPMDINNMENAPNKSSAPLAEQTIKGEIKRVVYASEDGAYTVLRVLDKNKRTHTVVGGIVGCFEAFHWFYIW